MTPRSQFIAVLLALVLGVGLLLVSQGWAGFVANVSLFGSSMSGQEVLKDGLILHYTFDGSDVNTQEVTTADTTDYTTAGSYTFTVPEGVTEIQVEAWGGGGGGGDGLGRGGGGGGGGAYAKSVFTVSPAAEYSVVVGTGGAGAGSGTTFRGGHGATSTFGTTMVIAVPGVAGAGGSSGDQAGGGGGLAASSTGQVTTSGGSGGIGKNTNDAGGGGGGAGGVLGSGVNGTDGNEPVNFRGGNGGAGNGTFGGAGGPGGNAAAGEPGTSNARGGGGGGGGADAFGGGAAGAPGGGGGGGEEGGGAGGAGQVIVSYNIDTYWETVVEDHSGNGNRATTTYDTIPVFDIGVTGQALPLPGNASLGPIDLGSGVRTVSFWVKFSTTTQNQKIINIDGTRWIGTDGSGNVTANAFPGTTAVYVDGSAGSTAITRTGEWRQIIITDTTGVTASTFEIGRVGDAYGGFSIDEVRVYDRVISVEERERSYRSTAAANAVSTSYAPPDLSRGLVGHWTFDAADFDWSSTTAEGLDQSGQGRHLNLDNFSSSAIRNWFIPGPLGQAIKTRRSGNTQGNSFAELSGTNPFSTCLWLYYDPQYWTLELSWALSRGYTGIAVGANRALIFSTFGTAPTELSTAEGILKQDAWTHVCGVYDGTKKVMYIDGAWQAEQTPGGSVTFQDSALALRTIIGGEVGFDGGFDDVRIYDRALSAEEVERLYRLGSSAHTANVTFTQPDLKDGLVGHWTFDGKDMDWSSTTAEVRDASGNNRSGNASSTMSSILSSAPGMIGQAIRLRQDEYLSLGNTIMPAGAYTKAAWVNRVPNSSTGNIFSGSGASAHVLWVNEGCGYILKAGHASGGGCWDAVTDTVPLAPDTWYHVAVTFTPSVDSGTMKLYKDGSLISTATGVSTHASGNSYIGAYDQHPYGMIGLYDDVRLYNRVLSDSEIRRLYEMAR